MRDTCHIHVDTCNHEGYMPHIYGYMYLMQGYMPHICGYMYPSACGIYPQLCGIYVDISHNLDEFILKIMQTKLKMAISNSWLKS